MHIINEYIVKNSFSVLTADKKRPDQAEIKYFLKIMKDLGISQREYNRYLKELEKSKEKLLKKNTKNENLEILSYMMISGYSNNISPSEKKLEIIKYFCSMISFDERIIIGFVRSNKKLDFSKNSKELSKWILNILTLGYQTVENGNEISKYIATQISKEGIDEIQMLYISYRLGISVALSGPPGVGKTESVIELSKIINTPLFTKVCSSRTTESHIIAHPILMEQNSVTVTGYQDGPLCMAMKSPGIFYGDEYNLLKEDVQKRMNSAFDSRKYIDRNDGSVVSANDGFIAIISYNPSENLGQRDLEDSVADRFIHYHYGNWMSDLKAYISCVKSSKDKKISSYKYEAFGINLELRGITPNGKFLYQKENKWYDFFSKKESNDLPHYRYYSLKTDHLNSDKKENIKRIQKLSDNSFEFIELARMFSKFTEIINELATNGKSPLLKKIGLGDYSKDNLELLTVHKSSTRIITSALSIYEYLKKNGFNKYLAQSFSTSIIINQICYGSYRERNMKDLSNLEFLETIAQSLYLYSDGTVYNTKFIKEKVL